MIPVLICCFRERKETRGKDKQANLLRWMVANLWLVYDDGSCPRIQRAWRASSGFSVLRAGLAWPLKPFIMSGG